MNESSGTGRGGGSPGFLASIVAEAARPQPSPQPGLRFELDPRGAVEEPGFAETAAARGVWPSSPDPVGAQQPPVSGVTESAALSLETPGAEPIQPRLRRPEPPPPPPRSRSDSVPGDRTASKTADAVPVPSARLEPAGDPPSEGQPPDTRSSGSPEPRPDDDTAPVERTDNPVNRDGGAQPPGEIETEPPVKTPDRGRDDVPTERTRVTEPVTIHREPVDDDRPEAAPTARVVAPAHRPRATARELARGPDAFPTALAPIATERPPFRPIAPPPAEPDVSIGLVEVIVERGPSRRPSATSRPTTTGWASKNYLRRL